LDVQIIGRHLEITPAIRGYASQKVEKLERFFDGLSRIRVNLSYEGGAGGVHRTELIFSVVRGKTLIAHAEDADLLASIDSAVDKGERLLTKFKEKIKYNTVREIRKEKSMEKETEIEEGGDIE